jgi:predicted RNA-binding protein
MAEVACQLDSTLRLSEVQAGTGGAILAKFRDSVKKANGSTPDLEPIAQSVADMFQALNKERTDFVHAYPITNDAKAQILHRRKDAENKYFEVTIDFLDLFITRLDAISDKLYEIRAIVSGRALKSSERP